MISFRSPPAMSVAGDLEIGEELRERMGLGRGSCPTYPGAKPVC
jgi:hypothetical protein